MPNNKRQSHGQQGFTLVEIMVAMLVFMIVMLGVAGGLIHAVRANRGNVVRDEALRLAEEELNRLKAEQFTVFGTSPDLTAAAWTNPPTNVLSNLRGGQLTFTRTRQVSDLATAATALKRIDVAVGWNDPSGGAAPAPTNMNRQVFLSTIIVRSD
ncbi:MAG: prepilin-type N-terminal cleavage/methylation domain-containing protein [Desulfurivibrionaceae bacterium]